jgi:tyrosinase
VYLNIENIEGKTNPGTMYGVYLNLPEHPDAETLEKHYAGAVSFFGIEHGQDPRKDENGHQLRHVLEVGKLLRSLGDGTEYGKGDVKVSFRPLGVEPPETSGKEGLRAAMAAPAKEARGDEPPVAIGRVSLSVHDPA